MDGLDDRLHPQPEPTRSKRQEDGQRLVNDEPIRNERYLAGRTELARPAGSRSVSVRNRFVSC